jgi:hypothetical protein
MPIITRKKFQTIQRLLLAATLHAGAAIVGIGPADAWGNVAHRAIANLAEQHLTPDAAGEVKRLLALEGAKELSEVVMWADMIRRQEIPGTPQHDVGIPFDAGGYDAERDCQNFCIVMAIPHYLTILADRSKSDAARLEALKYVAHLVGDIHQPLHNSQDGGSQLVAWDSKIVYLHILWDVTILAATYPTPIALTEAVSKRVQTSSECGTPEQWSNEGHHLEKTFVYPELGPERAQPIKISTEYAAKALPIIEERIVLATTRLICVLNNALDKRQ